MSNTQTFYHGTKYDVDTVMNNPMLKPSANGVGFFLTKDYDVAKSYGKVIAFEVPNEFEVDRILHTENGPEYVIGTTATMRDFLRNMEDVYVMTQQDVDELRERNELANMGLLEGYQF